MDKIMDVQRMLGELTMEEQHEMSRILERAPRRVAQIKEELFIHDHPRLRSESDIEWVRRLRRMKRQQDKMDAISGLVRLFGCVVSGITKSMNQK
jgi:hypothetical protein